MGFHSREGLVWAALLGLTLLAARFVEPGSPWGRPTSPHITDDWENELDERVRARPAALPQIVFPGHGGEP